MVFYSTACLMGPIWTCASATMSFPLSVGGVLNQFHCLSLIDVLLGTARSPAVCPRAQICVAKELSGDRVREIFDSFRRPAAWHYGSGRTVVHLDLNALNAESQQACVAIPGAGER